MVIETASARNAFNRFTAGNVRGAERFDRDDEIHASSLREMTRPSRPGGYQGNGGSLSFEMIQGRRVEVFDRMRLSASQSSPRFPVGRWEDVARSPLLRPIVASETAKFGQEITIGVIPGQAAPSGSPGYSATPGDGDGAQQPHAYRPRRSNLGW
jgi:hypothetical protein